MTQNQGQSLQGLLNLPFTFNDFSIYCLVHIVPFLITCSAIFYYYSSSGDGAIVVVSLIVPVSAVVSEGVLGSGPE